MHAVADEDLRLSARHSSLAVARPAVGAVIRFPRRFHVPLTVSRTSQRLLRACPTASPT